MTGLKMDSNIRVNVELVNGVVVEHRCTPTTTIVQLLSQLEKLEDVLEEEHNQLVRQGLDETRYVRRRFASYQGVPDVENIGPKVGDRSLIQIKINVIGTMEPVLTVGEAELTPDTVDFASYTVFDLCHHAITSAETDGEATTTARTHTLDVALRHRYRAPTLTSSEQQVALENLKRQIGFPSDSSHASSVQSGPAAPASTAATGATASTARRAPRSTPGATLPPVPKPKASLTVAHVPLPHAPRPPANGGGVPVEAGTTGESASLSEEGVPRVRDDEVEDSDDDSYYELNAGDLRVLAAIYQGQGAQRAHAGGADGEPSVSVLGVDVDAEEAKQEPPRAGSRFHGGGQAVGGVTTTGTNKDQRAAALRDRLLARMTGKAAAGQATRPAASAALAPAASALRLLSLRVRLPPRPAGAGAATGTGAGEGADEGADAARVPVLQSTCVDVEVSERARVQDLYAAVWECVSSAGAEAGVEAAAASVRASDIHSYPFALHTVHPAGALADGDRKLGNVAGVGHRSVLRLQWRGE